MWPGGKASEYALEAKVGAERERSPHAGDKGKKLGFNTDIRPRHLTACILSAKWPELPQQRANAIKTEGPTIKRGMPSIPLLGAPQNSLCNQD